MDERTPTNKEYRLTTQNFDQKTLIVGIGASAGGLEALKQFFAEVPPDAPISFVVVQHLSPEHDSRLAEILQRESRIKFCQATDKELIKPGHAYIIPPNSLIEVENRTIRVIDETGHRGVRMAIDHLFRSMGENYQSMAVGVIFSGTGTDGTAGLRALKAAGGLAIAQAVDDAEYAGMPQSAIDAGVVDETLPAIQIPAMLLDYAAHPYHQIGDDDNDDDPVDSELTKIRALLKAQENFDLAQYKDSTVKRRLFRRMSLTNSQNLLSYLETLRESADERTALMRDLLISVTDFFRDREAFEELDRDVLANIIDEAEDGEDIRVWVAGCATGEEAYTLSILLTEQIQESGRNLDIRIFATDIDERAIRIARRGVYARNALADLPTELVKKYFTMECEDYATVKSVIRDTISFAQQNVYTDPPFSKLHLVSCRNLLIYLQRAAQKKVLKSFYYSLLPQGYLFLGSSETVSEQKELFSPISNKWRIFSRKGRDGAKRQRAVLPTFFNNKEERPVTQERRRNSKGSENEWAKQMLLLAVKPSIIVDDQNRITYFHGDVNKFLQLPDEGHAVLDVYAMLYPEIRTRMRSGIYKARKTGERVAVSLPLAEDRINFQCAITPVSSGTKNDSSIVITFEEVTHKSDVGHSGTDLISHHDQDSMIDAMERELRETKDELQSTVEELETSTEELKAAHEEALSTNEELQSSNEELEASTEELRSLNEELTLVNTQLKDKISELSDAHADIKNFFASTNLATLFLSSDLRIKRYTPAAERLLRIGSQDLDQPISSLCRDLLDEDTLDEAQRVLDSLESSEKQINAANRWYIRKILPYQTEGRQVDGVVITFIDITTLKTTANRLKASSEQHEVIAKLGMKALSNNDIANLMDQVVREVTHTLNADFCKVLKYNPQENNLLVKAGIGWDSGVVGQVILPADNNSQAGFTLFTTEPVVVTNLASEQRFSGSALLNEHNVISGISCVIKNGPLPYGVISVHTRQHRTFNQEDIHFLVSAANILSVALHRRDIEEQLKTSENRLRVAKDSSRMGSFEWEFETGETYWDEMLYEIWGISGDEVTQEDFVAGLHEDDRELVSKQIELATDPNGDGHYHAIYRVVNPITHGITWVEANGQVQKEDNKPQRMIGMVVDITHQRELEASLKNAVRELQEADENKNEFLATLGHEIRNPLASISAATQILEVDTSKLKWALATMKSNVNLVASLLDELLDLTRISRGEIRLEKQTVNVNELLEEVVQNFSSAVEKNRHTLKLSLPPEAIVSYLDRVRIQQAINNIISNAEKFTPEEGQIHIKLTRNSEIAMTITVIDSGIGLDMQFKDAVFEPFHQIKNHSSRKNDGLGIGLSLVKQIAELHEGTVSIFSEGRDKGTMVSLILPISETASGMDKLPPVRTDLKPFNAELMSKLRVMMVDDNETVSDGLAMILGIKGCEVCVFNSASDALAGYQAFEPNVALLDIGLPDMSGNELIRKIKPNLPEKTLFLAITGYGHEEARKETLESGFDGHFNKPVQLDVILAELSTFASTLDE